MLLAAEGNTADAVRLCGLYSAKLLDMVAIDLAPDHAILYEGVVARLQARVGTPEFAVLWQAGQRMGLDEAFVCALKEPAQSDLSAFP